MRPEVSIVIPARDEGSHLGRTLDDLDATVRSPFEVVLVDDGSKDGSVEAALARPVRPTVLREGGLGVARARNLGAAASRGEVLVFLDGHMRLPDGWLAPLLDLACRPGVGAVAPAVAVLDSRSNVGFGLHWTDYQLNIAWLPAPGPEPFKAPLLPGAAFVIRRTVFEMAGGFDPAMSPWGSEDAELSLRLWLYGLDQLVHPGVTVEHLFRARHPYPIEAAGVVHNQLRVSTLHFSEPRLARVLGHLLHRPDCARALGRLLAGDAAERRRAYATRRLRSDDWFFAVFGEIN